MTTLRNRAAALFGKKLSSLVITIALTFAGLVATPLAANASGAIQKIAVGSDHMCALMNDGTVNCVGNNSTGELGNNTTSSSTTPVKVYGITNAVDISAGQDFSCAVLADGTARCWGTNALAQLGNGTGFGPGASSSIPVAVSITGAKFITSGQSYSCIRNTSNQSYCWGMDFSTTSYDAIGYSPSPNFHVLASGITQSGMSTTNWVTKTCFSTTNAGSCTSNGVARSGRDTGFGLIGAPAAHSMTAAISAAALGGNAAYSSIATNQPYNNWYTMGGASNSVCFLKSDSILYCSGSLLAGNGLANVVSVAAGNSHACAVISDGTVKCWGSNASGQFGNALISQPGITVYQVSSINNASKVFAAGDHTCAITQDGKVFCWGVGTSGELGQGAAASSNLPVQAIGVENPVSMTLAPQSSCATFADMSVKCWGLNTSSQLFTGSAVNITTPTTIGDFLIIQANTPTPSISGRPTEGQALTAVPGTWDAGMSLSYQWNRAGTPISGATGIDYQLAASDVGQAITVTVTSQKPGYRVESRTSIASATTESALVTTPVPTISGTAKVASTLNGTVGSWDAGVTTTLQWLRDGVAISGATTTSYLVASQDVGSRITLRVTGTKTGATTVVQTSDATAGVINGTQTLSPTPTISGTAAVGRTLTATAGTWDSGTSLTYQWYRGVNLIPAATNTSYAAVNEDLGYSLTVRVTSSKPGYDSVTVVSAATNAVATGSQTATPTPLITGTIAVGRTLTVNPGVWDGAVALTYKWMKDGVEIDGQNTTTYTLLQSDLDSSFSVAVTGYKPGFTTITRTSTATLPVAAGTFTQTTTPTIAGSATVGSTLTASTGSWDAGVTLALQWYRDGVEIAGQTSNTYVLNAADRAHSFTVEVTGTKASYNSVLLSSATTNVVTWGVQVLTPVPSVSGTTSVGNVLTAVPGVWDDGVALTYQWYRAGAPVVGETGTSYNVLPGDRGLTIAVYVTGAKTGYTSVTRSSAASTIGYGSFVFSPSPIISGTPIVGAVLSVYTGVWDVDTTFTYQWLRSGTAITGATATSYTLTPTDRAATITVTIIGSKTGFTSLTKTSVSTAVVDFGVQASQPTPQIVGTAAVGNILTAVAGSWDSGTSLTYQWFRNGSAVAGMTATSYMLTPTDRGTTLTVSVTGTKTAYTTVTLSSAATGTVDFGNPILTPNPTISGTLNVGNTVTASAGAWDSGTTFTYQWSRSGTPISGATATTYVLVADDYGSDISVAVTGNRTGYNSAVRFFVASSPIDFGTLGSTPVPTISGVVKVGVTLSAVTGTWDAGSTLTYRWFRDGVERLGIATSTYTLASSDLGRSISVTVTGYKPGYRSVAKASAASAAVGTGVQILQPTPTVSGTYAVGQTLTASAGVWDSGVLVSYQWLRSGVEISGANEYLYTVRPEDRNSALAVRILANKQSYVDVIKTSGLTPIVGYGALVASPVPLIVGTPRVGDTLSAVAGYWDDGTTLTYQWQRAGRAIAGATASNYDVAGADFNNALSVVVTGTKDGYVSQARTSAGTSAVVAGPFVLTSTPTIDGVIGLGERLTASPGSWDAGVVFSYQWLRDGVNIPGAIESTYLVNTADLGKAISVAVTGTKVGFITQTQTSEATNTINPLDITVAPVPTIAGSPVVGAVLTTIVGVWSPGVSVGIQWYRGGTAIEGATSATYRLSDADEGLQMSVVTTGTKVGYEPISQESEPTLEVAEGVIARAPQPVISGSLKIGYTLIGVIGTWDTGVTLDYQWLRTGDPIDGANSSTYRLTAEDVGQTMSLVVTGSRAGYAPKVVTSRVTAAVALGTLTMAQPRISGTAAVGRTLTLTHLPSNQADAEYSAQWYRSGVLIPGATGWTYDLSTPDLGKTITAKVTVTLDGFKDLALSTPKTAAVAYGSFTIRGSLTVEGAVAPVVGVGLSVDAGTWDTGATITYQWKRNGISITGARAATYVPVTADRGKRLTVTVVASKSGFKSVTLTSPSSAKVL